MLSFLRWKTLHVANPLRQIVQNDAGPVLLAAAHTAEALQHILKVSVSTQNIVTYDPHQVTKQLKTAREALVNSLGNLDIMIQIISLSEDLASEDLVSEDLD